MPQMKHKAYKFRIYPNTEQQVLLARTFGSVRLVYNHYLEAKTKSYEETGKSLSYTKCAADLVSFKKENPFLKEVDSIALQQALRHLDAAFQNFFREKKVGYPKFKSRKHRHDSYSSVCVNNNIRLECGTIVLPKIGKVRIKQHRIIPQGHILKSVTVSKTPTGKYFASVLFEHEVDIQKVEPGNIIGLDFSMHDLFVSSEDEVQVDEQFLHHYRKAQDRLAREQRILSHRQKGSRRYEKQRRKVALLHEKIANQRKDYIHKQSRQIANAYDLVCVEDLNMQGMSQALNFGKSVSDNAWGMFLRFLDYKLTEQGKMLVKIDKWFPSSKTCHKCGYVLEELSLNIRKWECPVCHAVHDRDRNAAKNIKTEGMRMVFA
ncbi:MAG: RNA-guided endonuclease TnpB family protein [Eubacteriaceae bacterium]|nr:RNA-guided endonuclease TnpB family protein [Eubacteriaceae bacterium]